MSLFFSLSLHGTYCTLLWGLSEYRQPTIASGHLSERPKVTNRDVNLASVQSQGYGTHSALMNCLFIGCEQVPCCLVSYDNLLECLASRSVKHYNRLSLLITWLFMCIYISQLFEYFKKFLFSLTNIDST